MFPEINDLHETLSDLAKNLSTLLVIFFFFNSIKNKCSMASGSRWDDCEKVEGIQMGFSERLSLSHLPVSKTCFVGRTFDPTYILFIYLYTEDCSLCVHGYISWKVIGESQRILKGQKMDQKQRNTHLLFRVSGWKFSLCFRYTPASKILAT